MRCEVSYSLWFWREIIVALKKLLQWGKREGKTTKVSRYWLKENWDVVIVFKAVEQSWIENFIVVFELHDRHMETAERICRLEHYFCRNLLWRLEKTTVGEKGISHGEFLSLNFGDFLKLWSIYAIYSVLNVWEGGTVGYWCMQPTYFLKHFRNCNKNYPKLLTSFMIDQFVWI